MSFSAMETPRTVLNSSIQNCLSERHFSSLDDPAGSSILYNS